MSQIVQILMCVLLAQQVVDATQDTNTTWSAKFTPNAIKLDMETQMTVGLELTNINVTHRDYVFVVRTQASHLATVLHGNISAGEIDVTTRSWSGNVTVKTLFLGATDVYVQLVDLRSGHVENNMKDVLHLTIVRKQRIIDHIFVSSVAILVSLLYINFGAALDKTVLRSLIARPLAPACGLACQFILMPLLSYGLGLLIFPNSVEMQIGLFFTGVSPSGGASNMWSVVLDGNINLSILMTTVGTFAAFITMPLWLFTLGVQIFERSEIKVPYSKITTFATSLIVPLAIGCAIQHWYPRSAQVLVRLLKPISLAVLVFIIVFATVTNLYIFELFSWQIAVAGLALPASGYMLGWLCAKMCGQRAADALTIAIETGIQNTGITIFLLRFTLDQLHADLTTVIPVAVAIMTPLPLLGIYVYKRTKKNYIDGEKISVSDEEIAQPRIYGTGS